MKTSKILSFAGGLFLLSMFFGSCKNDDQVAPAPKGKAHIVHLELTANVVKQIDVAGTKGFTLDVNHSGKTENSKTEAINWASDTWDNLKHKPQLIGVVKSKTEDQALKVWVLDGRSYEYNPGHGNIPAQVTIYADISVTGDESQYKVLFYLTNKGQSTYLKTTAGSISFTPGAELYDVSGASPVFQKNLDENVFVHPNDRIFFNFIFQGEIDLGSYNSKGLKNFDMKPLGSLLMVDFSPRVENDELQNPASIEGFSPSLVTNAFDINGQINVVSAKNTNTTVNEYTRNIKFEDYDNNGTSMEATLSHIKKISKTSLSDIYVKYVLPRDRTGFKFSIDNNDVLLYRNNSTTDNFYTLYNTKKYGMNLSMTSGAMPTASSIADYGIKYNPLSLVAEHNVALNGEEFDKTDNNHNSALLIRENASNLFAKPFLRDYHLPTFEEWRSIIPDPGNYVIFNGAKDVDGYIPGIDYNVQIGQALLSNIFSLYKTEEEPTGSRKYVTYAIRFISANLIKNEKGKIVNTRLDRRNCPYLSLWRYSYIDNPNGGGKMMKVYCYVLPKTYRIKYDDENITYDGGSGFKKFNNEEFFKSKVSLGEASCRVFPATGTGVDARDVDKFGYYWSSTLTKNGHGSKMMKFLESEAFLEEGSNSEMYAVRPFFGPAPKE